MAAMKQRNVPRQPKKKRPAPRKPAVGADLWKRDATTDRQAPQECVLCAEEHLGGLWKALGLM